LELALVGAASFPILQLRLAILIRSNFLPAKIL
jgi:hypothetical protein